MEDVTNLETEVTDAVEAEDDFEAFEQLAESDDEAGEIEDTATETDDDDSQDGEQSGDDDDSDSAEEDEIEIDGKKYRVPKDAALRQADYTRKTQALAERTREVDAAFERLQSIGQAETQAVAQVAIISAQLKSYEDVDWDAWEDLDAQSGTREAQKHWRIYQSLKEQQAEAVQNYTKAGEAKQSVVQQETAKRLDEADRYAAEKIPGWNADKAAATLDFARTTYDLSNDDIRGALAEKPGIIQLFHDAMVGRKVEASTAKRAKLEKQQEVKPVTVLKGNSGRVAVSPSTKDFAAFEKLANKSR